MGTENKDYLIPEFEKKLKKAEELKSKIDNPEPDRLLSTHCKLEEEYNLIFTEKVLLYKTAREAIEMGFKLIRRPDRNEIGYLDSYSDAGHPKICYAGTSRFTIPIATSRHATYVELTPKNFMLKLIAGDYNLI